MVIIVREDLSKATMMSAQHRDVSQIRAQECVAQIEEIKRLKAEIERITKVAADLEVLYSRQIRIALTLRIILVLCQGVLRCTKKRILFPDKLVLELNDRWSKQS
jgi:hypothetical protein